MSDMEMPPAGHLPFSGLTDEIVAEVTAVWRKAWYARVSPTHEECLRVALEAALPHLRCSCLHISDVDDHCPQHGRSA